MPGARGPRSPNVVKCRGIPADAAQLKPARRRSWHNVPSGPWPVIQTYKGLLASAGDNRRGSVGAGAPGLSPWSFILPLQQKPFPPTLTNDPREGGACFSLVPPEPCAIWESCSSDLHSQIPTWPWLPAADDNIYWWGATAWLSSVTVRQITPTSWQQSVARSSWVGEPWGARGCDARRPVAAKPRKQPRPGPSTFAVPTPRPRALHTVNYSELKDYLWRKHCCRIFAYG